MSAPAPALADGGALGWAGMLAGVAGVVAYVVIVLRRPDMVRILNGSGLLLTSLALVASRALIGSAAPSGRFSAEAAVALLMLAVLAQAAAGLRNRRAWDGTERRKGADGIDGRRSGLGGTAT